MIDRLFLTLLWILRALLQVQTLVERAGALDGVVQSTASRPAPEGRHKQEVRHSPLGPAAG
jgi:hypothetical protein